MKDKITHILWTVSAMLTLFTLSCFEEDERVMPYPGVVYTITDSVQIYQSYFDLESGAIVKVFQNNAWQLGFECGKEGWHIITNSGSNWFIYNTNSHMPDAVVKMPESITNLYDKQHAWPDSTAVGNWVEIHNMEKTYTGNIYLLGKLISGGFSELRQLKFLEITDTSYTFYVKEIATDYSDTVYILKDDEVNFVYYSFESQMQLNLEPSSASYDLIFGPYYDLATNFGQTIPYLVSGVLLNTRNTEAALDSINKYPEIDSLTVTNTELGNQRDIPGYRWKVPIVDVSGGGSATYLIRSDYNYMIRTSQNHYFKLRFLSFSLDGRNGFPRFQYQQL